MFKLAWWLVPAVAREMSLTCLREPCLCVSSLTVTHSPQSFSHALLTGVAQPEEIRLNPFSPCRPLGLGYKHQEVNSPLRIVLHSSTNWANAKHYSSLTLMFARLLVLVKHTRQPRQWPIWTGNQRNWCKLFLWTGYLELFMLAFAFLGSQFI